MARNGSGTYNRAVAPYVAGTTITAATVNSEMDDIATALTQSLSRDGQSPPTANLPMGNFRITGLGNAIASTDAATLGQVGVEIIQRQTVTSASAIDFTIPSGFMDCEVSWALNFSADAQLLLQSSVDGTTFPSGASDYQQAYIFNSGASGSNIGSSANNGILICPLADATTTGTGSFKFTSASGFRVQGATSMVLNAAGAQWEQGIAAGVRNSAALPLAFRMLPTSGTVTGTVTLRGMR